MIAARFHHRRRAARRHGAGHGCGRRQHLPDAGVRLESTPFQEHPEVDDICRQRRLIGSKVGTLGGYVTSSTARSSRLNLAVCRSSPCPGPWPAGGPWQPRLRCRRPRSASAASTRAAAHLTLLWLAMRSSPSRRPSARHLRGRRPRRPDPPVLGRLCPMGGPDRHVLRRPRVRPLAASPRRLGRRRRHDGRHLITNGPTSAAAGPEPVLLDVRSRPLSASTTGRRSLVGILPGSWQSGSNSSSRPGHSRAVPAAPADRGPGSSRADHPASASSSRGRSRGSASPDRDPLRLARGCWRPGHEHFGHRRHLRGHLPDGRPHVGRRLDAAVRELLYIAVGFAGDVHGQVGVGRDWSPRGGPVRVAVARALGDAGGAAALVAVAVMTILFAAGSGWRGGRGLGGRRNRRQHRVGICRRHSGVDSRRRPVEDLAGRRDRGPRRRGHVPDRPRRAAAEAPDWFHQLARPRTRPADGGAMGRRRRRCMHRHCGRRDPGRGVGFGATSGSSTGLKAPAPLTSSDRKARGRRLGPRKFASAHNPADMPTVALALVITAAVLHAGWNVLLKTSGDPLDGRPPPGDRHGGPRPGQLVAWFVSGRPPWSRRSRWRSDRACWSGLLPAAAAYSRGDLFVYPLPAGALFLSVLIGIGLLRTPRTPAPPASDAGGRDLSSRGRSAPGRRTGAPRAIEFARDRGLDRGVLRGGRIGPDPEPWLYGSLLAIFATVILAVAVSVGQRSGLLDDGRRDAAHAALAGRRAGVLADGLPAHPVRVLGAAGSVAPLRESGIVIAAAWGALRLAIERPARGGRPDQGSWARRPRGGAPGHLALRRCRAGARPQPGGAPGRSAARRPPEDPALAEPAVHEGDAPDDERRPGEHTGIHDLIEHERPAAIPTTGRRCATSEVRWRPTTGAAGKDK